MAKRKLKLTSEESPTLGEDFGKELGHMFSFPPGGGAEWEDRLRAELLKNILRIARESTPEIPGDCWIWLGPISSNRRRQYGIIRLNGKYISVRRLFYKMFGRTPVDLVGHPLDLKCGNLLCVNPNHMDLGRRRKGGRKPSPQYPGLEVG